MSAPDGLAGPVGAARLAGVVLAAGAGTRLRPLTDLRPKALCPVGGTPLLDHALARLRPALPAHEARDAAEHLAVNAHHLGEQVEAHVLGGQIPAAHLSREPQALGTAGALGRLRGWLDGRDVVVTNADAWLPAGLDGLLEGWDGERCRLLCRRVLAEEPADLRDPATGHGVRYLGACLLPWRLVRDLRAEPSGLYEVLWRAELARGRLDVARTEQEAVDCGTPARYLRANLAASGGRSVVGAGARVEGRLTRCVVWDGAEVDAGEDLVEVVRAGSGPTRLTVDARAAGDGC